MLILSHTKCIINGKCVLKWKYSQLCLSRSRISQISPKSKVYTRHLSINFCCFLPHISRIFCKSKLFLQSQEIRLRYLAVVYWIEPLTLNQRVPGSIPVRTSALLSFSKALYPHCCSPPRCINGYPVGCEWDYVSYCLSPFYRLTLWKLPRELRLRTISAVLNSIHWPG